jgi:hypothetical protein
MAKRYLERIDVQPFANRSIGEDVLVNVALNLICTYSTEMSQSPTPPIGAEGAIIAIDINCAFPASLGTYSYGGQQFKIGLLAMKDNYGDALADGEYKPSKIEIIGNIYRLWYHDSDKADIAERMAEEGMNKIGMISLPDGGYPRINKYRVSEKKVLDSYTLLLAMMQSKFGWCIDAMLQMKELGESIAYYKPVEMIKFSTYEYSCSIVEAMIGTDPNAAKYLEMMKVNRSALRPVKGDRKPDGYDRGLISMIIKRLGDEYPDLPPEILGVLKKCVRYGWK